MDVLPDKDELKAIWPRPNFRKLAETGEVSVRTALLHMIIYDKIAPKPPMTDFRDMRYYEWPPFWRAYVLKAREFWEQPETDLDVMKQGYSKTIGTMTSDRNHYELAMCAGGRATSRTVQGLLPLDGVDRDRLDFHEDLGWPSNPLLKDRDAFGVSQITNRRDGSSYWTPLFWKSARTAIPLGDRANGYRTKSAAVEALQGAAEEYLAVRAGIPIERVAERARLQLDDRALG
jgi:hypothetical protein